MKKTFVINIETKPRELNSRMMIAYEAIKRNYRVVIGSQDEISKLLKYLPKSIVFEKSISKNKIKKLSSIKKRGHKIVNLDEEGMASQNNQHFYLKQRMSEDTLKLTDFFFTWGSQEKELIESRYLNFSNKIIVTGNPRIDTWKPQNIELFRDEIIQIKKKFQNYIFITSNFASIQHARGDIFLKRQSLDYNKIESKRDEEIFNEKKTFMKKVYLKFVDMIKYLSSSLPNKTIVLRPHPADDIQAWKEKFKEFDNVFIEYKFSATPWIIASKCMIHSSCTTGIEGFFSGKPVFSYLPYRDHNFINCVSNSLSDICLERKQLLGKVIEVFQKDYKFNFDKDLKIKEIKPALENIDTSYTCKKIIDCIDNIQIPTNNKISNFIFKFAYVEDVIKKNLKRIFGYYQPKDLYEYQKMPGISIKEILDKINQLKITNKEIKDFKFEVKKVYNDVYLINN